MQRAGCGQKARSLHALSKHTPLSLRAHMCVNPKLLHCLHRLSFYLLYYYLYCYYALCVCGTISEKVAALCILIPIYFKPVPCKLDILFHNHNTLSKFRKVRVSSILLSTLLSVFEFCQLFPVVSFVAFFFPKPGSKLGSHIVFSCRNSLLF